MPVDSEIPNMPSVENSSFGQCRPVLDCGMIFHPDCGGRDFPSIPSDDLLKHLFGD